MKKMCTIPSYLQMTTMQRACSYNCLIQLLRCITVSIALVFVQPACGSLFSDSGSLSSMENAQRLLVNSAHGTARTTSGPFSCAAAVEHNGITAFIAIHDGSKGCISRNSASFNYQFGSRFITYTVGRNTRDVSSANKIICKNTASFLDKQFIDICAGRLAMSLADTVHGYTKRSVKPLSVNTIIMDRHSVPATSPAYPPHASVVNNAHRIFKVDLSGNALACKAACIGTASPILAEEWMAANFQSLLHNCSTRSGDCPCNGSSGTGDVELQCVQFVKNAVFRGILDAAVRSKGHSLSLHSNCKIQLTLIRSGVTTNQHTNTSSCAESISQTVPVPIGSTVGTTVLGPLCIPRDYFIAGSTTVDASNCTGSDNQTINSAAIVDIDIETFYRDYIHQRSEEGSATGETYDNSTIENVNGRDNASRVEQGSTTITTITTFTTTNNSTTATNTGEQRSLPHKRRINNKLIQVDLPRSELLRRGLLKTKWKQL